MLQSDQINITSSHVVVNGETILIEKIGGYRIIEKRETGVLGLTLYLIMAVVLLSQWHSSTPNQSSGSNNNMYVVAPLMMMPYVIKRFRTKLYSVGISVGGRELKTDPVYERAFVENVIQTLTRATSRSNEDKNRRIL